MKITHRFTRGALALAIGLGLLSGCGRKDDAITQAEKKDKYKPSIAETKAIAEEGFIYGLPIVMNYAVMYEYAVDRNSGQFKAPFNEIKNEARVYTYKDTAIVTPNSDTPYSLLFMDLRAEPIVLSVPAVEKKRYYSVMLCDGNTFNYGYIGSRATGNAPADYLVAGPRWQGETPKGITKVFQSTTDFSLAVFRTQLFNAGDMAGVIKVQNGYKVQPLSSYLKQPAPAAPTRQVLCAPDATRRAPPGRQFIHRDALRTPRGPPAPSRRTSTQRASPRGCHEMCSSYPCSFSSVTDPGLLFNFQFLIFTFYFYFLISTF